MEPLIPTQNTNPVLNEIMGLSPEAKTALGMAGHTVPQLPAAPAPHVMVQGTPEAKVADQVAYQKSLTPPPVAPIHMPDSGVPKLGASAMPSASLPVRGTVAGDTLERQRLLSAGPGEDQIYSKIAHSSFGQNHPLLGKILGGAAEGVAKLGDIGLSAVAPEIAINIPGTYYHHQMLLNGANNALAGSQAEEQKKATTAETEAKAANLNLQPELKEKAAELALEKQHDTVQHQQAVLDQQRQLQLARNGQMEVTDATGKTHIVDDPESQVFQGRKALADYHGAQVALDQARTELANAGNNPDSPAYKLALAKAETAQQNAGAAAERAQAYMMNAQTGAFGTYNGQAVPGAMVTDAGQPVGSRFSANLRPTGQERGRADLGESALQQINDMKGILTKRSDLFGPGAGRITNFQTWVGSQDPDAQRFRAAAQVASDHLAGVFGGRSEAALAHIYSVVGQNITNPKAAIAGLNQIESTLPGFIKKGTPRTVGSNAELPGGQNPPNGASDKVKRYNPATGRLE